MTTHLPNGLGPKMNGVQAKRPLVQILAAAANIQMRTLTATVEKGSM